MPAKETPRSAALTVLLCYEKQRKQRLKADSLINETLNAVGREWSSEDRSLFSMLVYGVLRSWHRLSVHMTRLSRFPLDKTDPVARTLLRLGLFQLDCLDQVPDYAAIDTTIELARARKLTNKTLAFLNATLRSFQREQQAHPPALQTQEASKEWASALPDWFAALLLKEYGAGPARDMAECIQRPPRLSIRINTQACAPEDFKAALEEAGVPYESGELPEMVQLSGFQGSPKNLPGYEAGWFYVQDPSSAQVAHWMAPQPGERVLDLCAAPGSKTTHMAALQPACEIVAVEPVAKRLAVLEQNLARLAVGNVQTIESRAEDVQDAEGFDRILVDAPCSGLGTVRRHPEILVQMRECEIADYPARQLSILRHAVCLLKPGGTLVYSTCSLARAENQAVVETLLAESSELTLEAEEQRPISASSDGFYLARLRRNAAIA